MAHDWLAGFIANEGKGVSFLEEPLFGYRLHTDNVFGGRSFTQNISRWQKKQGKSYESYLHYRQEVVIDLAYLDGVKMCLDYSQENENQIIIKKLIDYYESLKKSKYINWHFSCYLSYLTGKNLGKKEIKEILIFHFPIIGYLVYRLAK